MPQAPHSSAKEDPHRQHPFPPNPVRYRNMAEQIAAAIRQAIAGGKLPPGSRLLEMKIAQEMGTSRGPLREALFQLEQEGWVVRKPNRGTFVVGLTEEAVRQIASLRGVLEGFGASLAANRLAEEDFHCLDGIVAEMSAMARARDFAALVERDYQFHEYIMRASGHPLLYETWSGLDRKIRMYLSALNRMYENMTAVIKGHLGILQALRRRDVKLVTRIMAEHMVEALHAVVSPSLRGRKSAGWNNPAALSEAISATIEGEQRRELAVQRSRR